MPRNPRFNEEQIQFIMENKHKGAQYLADELGVKREDMYHWGTRNKISVKKRDYPAKDCMPSNRTAWAWPRHYSKNKKNLVMRDGLRCHYCDYLMSYDEAQIDHVLPKVRGGSDAPFNLVLCCARCNNLKSTLCYSCPEFRNAISTPVDN
jgi:hypothetical protein